MRPYATLENILVCFFSSHLLPFRCILQAAPPHPPARPSLLNRNEHIENMLGAFFMQSNHAKQRELTRVAVSIICLHHSIDTDC